ncbi:MAG: hypothetical protein RL141_640 [Candidatus Parcubacteria bacterium]|jgi:glycosyltransferase involved in cell wall biosynthesis
MTTEPLTKPRVSVTIAALNEEHNIERTVRECLALRDRFELEVLVVLDSKTTDRTAAVAEAAGARVIQTGAWQGKGAALRKAMPFVTGDYVVQIDADYQFMPFDIPNMLAPIVAGTCDVTVATRYEPGAHVEGGSVTGLRRFGIWGLSLATSIAAGQRITDMLAGFKAFKTPVLRDIDMRIDHYGYEAEVIIKAAQKKYRIRNIPITYKKRPAGASNVSPWRHGFLILGSILKTFFRMV